MRSCDETPWVPGMPFARVLRVGPREVMGPRDQHTWTLAREADERLGQRQVLVHRHDVVHDDPVRLDEYRPQLAHELFNQRVVRSRAIALRERSEVTQHARVSRVDLGNVCEAHALRRPAPTGDDRDVRARVAERDRVRPHDLLDSAEDRGSGVVDEEDAWTPARHAVAAALVTRPRPPTMRSPRWLRRTRKVTRESKMRMSRTSTRSSHAGRAGSTSSRCVL